MSVGRGLATLSSSADALVPSARELMVLQLAWDGLSMKESAAALGLSWKTVKNYRANLAEKWQVRNVEGLLRQGVERGFIGVVGRRVWAGTVTDWPG